jgi:type IV secretory pathway TrbD component
VRARDLLKDWAGEGFITAEQYAQMEQETACDLRRTNIFLRIVLFLFTLVIAGAAAGLFFTVFLSRSSEHTTGVFLAFAVFSYAAAELAVSQFHLYRYGIEEALAVCSVAFLWVGIYTGVFGSQLFFSTKTQGAEFLVPAAGAILSLWIWHRFGFHYAFLAAMIFLVRLPGYWTSSHAAQHVIVAALYLLGLIAVVAVRPRHRLTYLNTTYSVTEGLLWLGIYLTINLQLSSLDLAGRWLGDLWPGGMGGGTSAGSEFSKPFYWATFVLIWCWPPIVLARGLRLKDRFVIAAGALAACLTLVTNKPYLGWQRHTWDPMLFGVVLMAVALFIRRWLARGPEKIRQGFTARRLSGKDKLWMDAGIASVGLAAPNIITPSPQPGSADVHFGGGSSGGGGASSDF